MSYLISYNIVVTYIIPSIVSVLIMKFGIYFLHKLYPSFFGVCLSNHKTSLYHNPMLRGLGIMFPLASIPFFFQIHTHFQIHSILLIIISCLIGFWDDKKSLSQKSKLFFLYTVAIFYLLADYMINSQNTSVFLDYFINSFYTIILIRTIYYFLLYDHEFIQQYR